jgi:hypothetical protein
MSPKCSERSGLSKVGQSTGGWVCHDIARHPRSVYDTRPVNLSFRSESLIDPGIDSVKRSLSQLGSSGCKRSSLFNDHSHALEALHPYTAQKLSCPHFMQYSIHSFDHGSFYHSQDLYAKLKAAVNASGSPPLPSHNARKRLLVSPIPSFLPDVSLSMGTLSK